MRFLAACAQPARWDPSVQKSLHACFRPKRFDVGVQFCLTAASDWSHLQHQRLNFASFESFQEPE